MFGVARAYHLGWRRRSEEAEELPEGAVAEIDIETTSDVDVDEIPPVAKGRGFLGRPKSAYKRHITMGLLWIIMGLFLLISTALNAHR